MKKVVLYAYAHGNLGDDLFVRTICERYPNISFYIQMLPEFDYGLKDLKNLHIIKRTFYLRIKDRLFRMFNKPSVLFKHIKEADATVLLGGSMFIQGDGDTWVSKLQQLQSIASASKRFYVIGANFGPYTSDKFVSSYSVLFKKAVDVCFRDESSRILFDQLTNVRVGSDVVCSLKLSSLHNNVGEKRQLSIIPISLALRPKLNKFRLSYYDKMARLIQVGIDKGYNVVLHAFCIDQGDNIAIDEIMSRLPKTIVDQVSIDTYDRDIISSLNKISKANIVVTTRFHGMILGWLSNAMVVPIKYDIKMDNLLNDLNFQGLSSSISDVQNMSIDEVFRSNTFNINGEQMIQRIKEQYENPFEKLDALLMNKD